MDISANNKKLIRTFINEINNAPDEAFDGKTYAEYYATMSEDSKSGCAALIDEVCSYEDYKKQTAMLIQKKLLMQF